MCRRSDTIRVIWKRCGTGEYVILNFPARGRHDPRALNSTCSVRPLGVSGGHDVDFTGDGLFIAFKWRG